MNKNIWYTLLVTTIIIYAHYNIHAAEFPVVYSVESLKKVPDNTLFQFSDEIIIDVFDKWSEGGTACTPLKAALKGDSTFVYIPYAKANNIPISSALAFKLYTCLKFPPAQGTRIIEHLLSTKKASANEKYEGIKKGDTPLHLSRYPEHIALLIKYGGDLTARNGVGHSPLEEAITHDYLYDDSMQSTKAFLANGAPVVTEHRLRCILPRPPSKVPFLQKMAALLTEYEKK